MDTHRLAVDRKYEAVLSKKIKRQKIHFQDDPLEAAQTARKQGITIHVVAVDDEAVPPNRKQLNEIAMNQKVGPIVRADSSTYG